jgi:hypothetical protein
MYSKLSKEYGLNWYDDVNDQCKTIAEYYDIPLYKVCGIVSALSPRNKFRRNMLDAIEIIKHGKKAKVATFHNNRDKAVRILNAKNSKEVYREFRKSLKTRNFYLNILRGKCNFVTVDVWMIRAYREHITTKSLTNKGYLMIEKLIQDEAKELGIYANQLQAIKWCEIRGAAA